MKQISWPGGGDHEDHTVTAIERWPVRVDDARVTFGGDAANIESGRLTCGRVRCSCGDEWDVGGWPIEVYDEMVEGL